MLTHRPAPDTVPDATVPHNLTPLQLATLDAITTGADPFTLDPAAIGALATLGLVRLTPSISGTPRGWARLRGGARSP